MRQLREASDGASFAGLSAGILWMPFGPDGILWTTVRNRQFGRDGAAASKSLMYSSQVSGPAHSWLHRTHRTLSQPASALTRTEGFRPGRHPCVNRRPILTPAERGCWRLVQVVHRRAPSSLPWHVFCRSGRAASWHRPGMAPRPQPGRPRSRADPHPPALCEGQRVHAHPDSY
jgi:hypothetical protein